MLTNFIAQLFQGSSRDRLRQQLLTLVHGNQNLANRLITYEKSRNPAHTEQWYLEKVIYDLRR